MAKIKNSWIEPAPANTLRGNDTDIEAAVKDLSASEVAAMLNLVVTVRTLPAWEDLTAGDFVNVFDDGGVLKVRKAIASTAGKEAHGFVEADVISGSDASVRCTGVNNQLSGLSGGPRMYLSKDTAGAVTATAPVDVGEVVQMIGWRLSATEVSFQPQEPIELA